MPEAIVVKPVVHLKIRIMKSDERHCRRRTLISSSTQKDLQSSFEKKNANEMWETAPYNKTIFLTTKRELHAKKYIGSLPVVENINS